MGVFSNAHLCLPTWDDGSKEGYHLQPATLMFTKPRSLSLWGTCFLLTPKRSVSFPIHNQFCQSIVAPSATSPPGSRCSRCSSRTALFGSPHCFEERVHQNFGMAKMFRFSSLSMAIDWGYWGEKPSQMCRTKYSHCVGSNSLITTISNNGITIYFMLCPENTRAVFKIRLSIPLLDYYYRQYVG